MTSPYYEDEWATLYFGDCREVTEWLSADVLVTDPPYGSGYTSGRVQARERKGTAIVNDHSPQARDLALRAWGPVRPALVFGTWKVQRPSEVQQVLIWDKSEGNGHGLHLWSPWGMSHEEVYVLGQWPPIVPGGRLREGGQPARDPGVLRVRNYNTQAADRPAHPTPKPVALMERLLRRCPPGVVADPFAGSGSTLVAAKQLGRKAIGVEVDERYCEIAARRLTQDVLNFREPA